MTNQNENRMSILSGVFAATFVDGLYSICENVEVLTELYALLNTLCENNQYAEIIQLLRDLSTIMPTPAHQYLLQLTANEEYVFVQQFIKDFYEILCEYLQS
ncbi:MAG: hypothetical protein K2M73_06040 [Lachnospiraceae bacterium]|nr:hypothetical protein [Lachnospiraceae bacterium]